MAAVDLDDCKLLEALHDAWRMVQFFETAEGLRVGQLTDIGMLARTHFSDLLMEASKRELNYVECLQ